MDLFYGDYSIAYHFVDEENGSIISQKDETGDISYTLDETKEELLDLVDKTGEPYFFGTNGSNLIVGADQDMIEEVINLYWRKEEVINLYWRKLIIHVDGNGSYSVSMKIAGENE